MKYVLLVLALTFALTSAYDLGACQSDLQQFVQGLSGFDSTSDFTSLSYDQNQWSMISGAWNSIQSDCAGVCVSIFASLDELWKTIGLEIAGLLIPDADIVDAVGLAWDLYSAYGKANAIISCVQDLENNGDMFQVKKITLPPYIKSACATQFTDIYNDITTLSAKSSADVLETVPQIISDMMLIKNSCSACIGDLSIIKNDIVGLVRSVEAKQWQNAYITLVQDFKNAESQFKSCVSI